MNGSSPFVLPPSPFPDALRTFVDNSPWKYARTMPEWPHEYPDDLAKVIVRLPVRAAKKFRAAAGEFLHRLNCDSRRKLWEIDYDDGEIRLSCFTDTLVGAFTDRLFRALLNSLVEAADAAFPYLTSVLSGRMSPEFAADQAQAAVQVGWSKEK